MTGRGLRWKIAVSCTVSLAATLTTTLAARAAGTIDFEASVPDSQFQHDYCLCPPFVPYEEGGFAIGQAASFPGIFGNNPAFDAT